MELSRIYLAVNF